jgi:hypothetical protein
VEKYGTTRLATVDNILRHRRLEFWVTTATGTHSEYVIGYYYFSYATMVKRKCLNPTFICIVSVL